MPKELLIIFVKAARPGQVKTRLAEKIGAEGACAAYRQIAGIVRDKLRSMTNVQARFTPDDAALEIARWLPRGWDAAPQGQGELGERLRNAFRDGFKNGAERVVIIGSDAPDVCREDIKEAFAALAERDVILGPAEDGGYWLIGLRSEQGRLFEEISWSSDSVLAETVARAKESKLKVHLLHILSDIDTVEDWRRFQTRVAQES